MISALVRWRRGASTRGPLPSSAMLYVIFAEVLPETHRAGRERAATLSLVIGFVVMMALDLTLG